MLGLFSFALVEFYSFTLKVRQGSLLRYKYAVRASLTSFSVGMLCIRSTKGQIWIQCIRTHARIVQFRVGRILFFHSEGKTGVSFAVQVRYTCKFDFVFGWYAMYT